jgi:Zn-dependent protease with chaperone function
MNAGSHPSLFGRALLAVLLTIGFYGLALGIAFGLLYLIYIELTLGEFNIRLTLFALIGALIILWSIFPRIDQFVAPGPQMTRRKFPSLFRELDRIAKLTRQEMPREVYLVPDVNAFVAERGGFMGVGSRRIMGIGLPLIHLLNVDELNAVLAHEFGHFYGGDTALGPWVYKTRAVIVRTVMNLGQADNWLMIPFQAYANMFLRVTNAISRQQEFSADQLAARTAGARAGITGLQKVHKYGQAFAAFFNQEYLPILNAGYQPPMLEGFDLFLKAQRIVDIVNQSFEEQLTRGKTDPFDTHPSLKERIAALENLPTGASLNDRPASTLLPPGEDLEGAIVRYMLDHTPAKERPSLPRVISWKDAAETALVPLWEKNIDPYRHILKSLTISGLHAEARNGADFFEKLARAGNILPANVTPAQVPQDVQLQFTNNVIGSAIAFALKQNGWQVRTSPGEELVLAKAGKQIKPFNLFINLATQESTNPQWQLYCEENGIASLTLAG